MPLLDDYLPNRGSQTFRVDDTFSSAEQRVIAYAAAQWEEDSAVRLTRTTDASADITITRGPLGLLETGQAYFHPDSITVTISPIVGTVTEGSTAYRTVLHELGHTLGLGHADSGIMEPTALGKTTDEPTPDALDALATMYGAPDADQVLYRFYRPGTDEHYYSYDPDDGEGAHYEAAIDLAGEHYVGIRADGDILFANSMSEVTATAGLYGWGIA